MDAETAQNKTLTPRLALLVTAHLFVLDRRNVSMGVRQKLDGQMSDGFHTQESHLFGRFHRYLNISAQHLKRSGFDDVDWLRDYAIKSMPGLYHGYHLERNALMAWTVRDIVQDILRSADIGKMTQLPDDLRPEDRALLRAALTFMESFDYASTGPSAIVESLLRVLDPHRQGKEERSDIQRSVECNRWLELAGRLATAESIVTVADAAHRARVAVDELTDLVRSGKVENRGKPRRVRVRLGDVQATLRLPLIFPSRALHPPVGVLLTPFGEIAFQRGPAPTDLLRRDVLAHVEIVPSPFGVRRLGAFNRLEEFEVREVLNEANFDLWMEAWARAEFRCSTLGFLDWEKVSYGLAFTGMEKFVLYGTLLDQAGGRSLPFDWESSSIWQ
ncbi:MAG: hypothetical protein Q8M65_01045 [Rhodoglobus sp.]|nr:hypothetical protein [Rhodoglobus sp.]